MRTPLLLLLFALPLLCTAQWYAEPVAGYQVDTRQRSFRQINTALQFSYITWKYHEVIFQLQHNWPLSTTTSDSAFSQNPALPVFTKAGKTISPQATSIAIGHRLKVIGAEKANTFSLLLFSGVKYEKIKVSYAYDKTNYTILNPDKTVRRTSIYLAFGAEYMRTFKKGRLFFQLGWATPPFGKKPDYPSSSKFVSPLSLNAGYSIPLKSAKNEKK